ncbi:hypothetical protein GTW69_14315, partial [Streptomyces sp. SID7760]|nr:hypothetical protein [Streptomyces sp. SID7760]
MAASVGLIPGVAHAGPATPGTAGPHGVSAPDVDLNKVAASNFTTVASPAERTVHTSSAAKGNGKAGATPQSESGAAAEPTVSLTAKGTSARGISLALGVVSEPGTALSVNVAWGDGTSVTFGANGPTDSTQTHSYAEIGSYTIKVTLSDGTGERGTNELAVVTPGSDFTPYAPTRLLDTRDGTGTAKGKVAPYATARVKIAGNGSIPVGVTAVVLNVTATNTTSGGHVTAYPEGSERPATSNVNFTAGQTVPNLVIVPVNKNGYVDLYNGGWEPVDLIADVTGYFTRTSSSGYTALNPSRFLDTREGLGGPRGQVAGQGTIGVRMTGNGGVPYGATAVALNVTVTNPREDGHLT